MTGAPKVISLENCFVKACQEKDTKAAEAGYCIELEVKLENSKKIHHFFADSEIDRSEWVQAIRKSAVNSSIDNGYEIHRNDKNSKLGSGSYSTVWKCYDRESRKVFMLYHSLSARCDGTADLGTQGNDEVEREEGGRGVFARALIFLVPRSVLNRSIAGRG